MANEIIIVFLVEGLLHLAFFHLDFLPKTPIFHKTEMKHRIWDLKKRKKLFTSHKKLIRAPRIRFRIESSIFL